jgi:hypothetical protein
MAARHARKNVAANMPRFSFDLMESAVSSGKQCRRLYSRGPDHSSDFRFVLRLDRAPRR